MQAEVGEFLDTQRQVFNVAWKKFFYNEEPVVRFLRKKEEFMRNLSGAGEVWLGSGWNTTTVAKAGR